MKNILKKSFHTLLLAAIVSSCAKERSPVTGWAYNDPTNGGFEKVPYEEQETGPGLVLVEGGTFTMGRIEDDVQKDWNNIPRRVTVSSFYLDETEVSNFAYLEYLYWTGRVFKDVYPDIYTKALPDTLVWREKLAYNEPYVDYYLRHPSYRDYPVVGVNWLQANEFCVWRTDRVNEFILVREGLTDHTPLPTYESYFSTDAYLSGKEFPLKTELPSFDDANPTRRVRMEDGIFLPKYRLPTEAEWEFAAYGLIGNTIGERITDRRIYPWNGHGTRNPNDKYIGQMMANFVRGGGDYMGTAGWLNDNADVTAPVYSYWPNDYGLYNMAGNVSEWVMDVYRPNTISDADEFRPFRGNVFKTQERDTATGGDNAILYADSVLYDTITLFATKHNPITQQDTETVIKRINISNVPGRVKWRDVSLNFAQDNLEERRNYKTDDYINFKDGDLYSSIYYDSPIEKEKLMYEYSKTSLVNDKARVYKGGSWRDRNYYMNPGTRRYLDERQSLAWLGFRCAMTRVGSPTGLGSK